MRVAIEAVGVLAPGLAGWERAREVFSGRGAFAEAPMDITPNSLAPAERRRSSPTVRLAIATAEQALAQTTLAPQDMALVFSSAEAAGAITHQLCEALAGTREVSPTQFHNSVHNAPSGYYSIAMNAKLGATSICRGAWSFGAGLLAAAVQATADDVPVLFVCYDSPLPSPLSDVMPLFEATAIAIVIAPRPGCSTVAEWRLAVTRGGGEIAWPGWMPARWQANASTRGLAALATLCKPAGVQSTARLPLSPELDVELHRC